MSIASKLILIFLSFYFLSQSSAYKTIRAKLEKRGSHVKIEFEMPTESLWVEFPDDSNLTITKTSPPEIKPGYKFTFNGTWAVFEILKVTEDQAGRYTFDFQDASVDLLYYDVILTNLSCRLEDAGGLILKSDCLGVKRDKMAVWCHLDLFPKSKLYFKFKWRTNYGRQGTMKVTHANDTYIEAHEPDVVFEEDDGFECSANTLHWSGKFSGKDTIYAMNKTVKELTFYKFGLMHPYNRRPVECQAVTSASINCTYEWFYLGGSNTTTFPGSIMREEDIKEEGLYECLASCAIKQHSPGECVLLSDRFEFSFHATGADCSRYIPCHSLNVIAIVLVVVILFAVAVYLCVEYRKWRSTRRNESSFISFLRSIIPGSRQQASPTVAYDSRNQQVELLEPSTSPTNVREDSSPEPSGQENLPNNPENPLTLENEARGD